MNSKLKKYVSSFIIEEESIPKIILRYVEHNPEHFTRVKISGKEIYPCARCFGHWIGLLVGFILTSPFWLGIIHVLDQYFLLIFVIAWLFAIPTIVDWTTIKIGLRKGNNNLRVVVGFLHGVGAIIYFFVLPADIIFKILTYSLYSGGFILIRRLYNIKHYKIKK
jgi:uncharacterized membrane protein